ncbi:MAG: hypothetical protein QOF98_1041 [Streptomyces sp.]|jgi:predicted GNAT superfamily acetyltransferase|nr:hypothetical protein [Streptomyces sp.]
MRTNTRIRELAGIEELRAATDLITEIWQTEAPPVPFPFMQALAHSGGQLLGGFVEGRLAGVAVGFLGSDADGLLVHSHVVGVHEKWRGTGVGRAIKLGQRDWCLARGIQRITWTFDPLRAGNAYFNLTKLGATGVAYYPDFYGRLDDGFNRDMPTDRVLVHWDLPDTGPDHHPAEQRRPGETVRLRVPAALPEDAAQLLACKLALREAMEPLLRSGFRWTGADRDGTYVLTAPE